MRFVALIVLGLLVVSVVGGCATFGVSREDVAMLRELRASWVDMGTRRAESLAELYAERKAVYEKIEVQKNDIMMDVEAGIISIDKAERLYTFIEREAQFTLSKIESEITEIKDDYDEQKKITDARIKELEAKGYKWWQIVGSLLGTFGAGVLTDKKRFGLGTG